MVILYGSNPSRTDPPRAIERAAVPAGPDGAEVARAVIERVLREWGRSALVPTATLCASELLAGTPDGVRQVEVVLSDHGDAVEVDLEFVGRDSPVLSLAVDGDGPAPHLTVVDRTASLWGVVSLGCGERVWFELDG